MKDSIQNGNWSRNPERAIEEAIQRYKLFALGWRGFDALDWVSQLLKTYPLVKEIASKSSSISGLMLEELDALLTSASKQDRPLIHDYFVGKLALEELSCRANGAGAGACDKRAAFRQIFCFLQESRA